MSSTLGSVAVVALCAVAIQVSPAKTCADQSDSQSGGESPAKVEQVVIRARLVEIDRKKMRQLGCDFATFEGGKCVVSGQESPPRTVTGGLFRSDGNAITTESPVSATTFGFVDALCQNKIARVLADPTIAMLVDRPASFRSGGTIQTGCRQGSDGAQETTFIGTELDVATHVVEGDRIRVELRFRWSELDDAGNGESCERPAVRRCEIDTALEVDDGKSFLLAGAVNKQGTGEQAVETQLLLLITPELVGRQASEVERAVHVGRASSSDEKAR